jgi:hypothetical protein
MALIEPVDRTHDLLAMECRASRHWMARQLSPPPGWRPPPGSYWAVAKHVIHYECQRCGTWRRTAIDYMGTILATQYEYPDWYRRVGEGRLAGDELRLWSAAQTARDRRAQQRRSRT